ncbi:hypothetical protein HB943_15385 [Listeria weihenstephanensis]|uniref:Uncharacterized protein n=1 Tax=Listeria weihenstephanensis TaxID=1006155 RepID=A0A841ZCI4_9LIST|nr:hypothetical protein [Listeria weihenstephanensis]MBC1501983.1 hypothetical protein [Listeria weihenstephanensis]
MMKTAPKTDRYVLIESIHFATHTPLEVLQEMSYENLERNYVVIFERDEFMVNGLVGI